MDSRAIPTKLNEAWSLFDTGNVEASRELYMECLRELTRDMHDFYVAALMGLVYVESFCGNFEQARVHANELLKNACDDPEAHIFLHQAGMVERMAGMYTEAMDFFLRERKLLLDQPLVDQAGISANFYETGYINLMQAHYEEAEQDLRASLKAGCESGDMECIGCAYRGLGELYVKMSLCDFSHEMYQKAIEAFAQADDMLAVREVKERLERFGLADC